MCCCARPPHRRGRRALAQRLTAELIGRIVALIPESWLEDTPHFNGPREHRDAYVRYLTAGCRRRAALSRRPWMRARSSYDYAIVRVVPHVERGEFVNAGVIVFCASQGFLKARIELDEARVRALDATADLESIRAALASDPACAPAATRRGRSGACRCASASTGWWHRAARASRCRRCTWDEALTWTPSCSG